MIAASTPEILRIRNQTTTKKTLVRGKISRLSKRLKLDNCVSVDSFTKLDGSNSADWLDDNDQKERKAETDVDSDSESSARKPVKLEVVTKISAGNFVLMMNSKANKVSVTCYRKESDDENYVEVEFLWENEKLLQKFTRSKVKDVASISSSEIKSNKRCEMAQTKDFFFFQENLRDVFLRGV